ncbi:VOC family protein [Novosphingobium tardum]
MQVNALDHVNIITADLDGTARFYGALLDLERRDGPHPLPADKVQWMHDAVGRAIFHINSEDFPRAYDRAVAPGTPTGAIHHVALNCSGRGEVVARLNAMGADYKENDVASIGLRQIFVTDPNNVLLELNFYEA